MSGVIPLRYRGVWQRTLLETPTLRDDTTFVRWLQTGGWHADLRVPTAARGAAGRLDLQQGFSGRTEIETRDAGEICHWLRELDVHPPGPHPDAGWMVFETTERVIETGVHGVYREVWERIPESTGQFIALGRDLVDGVFRQRLLLAGRWLMHVDAGSADAVIEISFGAVHQDVWQIERSTRPALEGRALPCAIRRIDDATAVTEPAGAGTAADWQIVEWDVGSDSVV